MEPLALLHELEPRVGELLDRHLASAKEWFPHEFVPYSRGRDFERGRPWQPDDADTDLPEAVRSALFVNLLTEDNLPYYFSQIATMFGDEGPYGTWVRRWTAEEGRHSIAIRDYLTVTRAIDPVELERARMIQVSGGEVPRPESPLVGMAYVALQEMATRIAHRNTGRVISEVGDPAGYEVMSRVAADENLHHLFYRDLVSSALEIAPSEMVIAIEETVRTFAMPGTGIPNFDQHSAAIARAGIYDAGMFHEQVLVGIVVNQWRLPDITGLDAAGEKARTDVLDRIDRLGKLAARLAARRERSSAPA